MVLHADNVGSDPATSRVDAPDKIIGYLMSLGSNIVRYEFLKTTHNIWVML